MDLHYERLGDGPALIVLHGLYGSGSNWRSIARVLSAERTVYLIDQRNHGRSPHAEEISYEALAADLGEFLDRHGIGAAAVMGHSMGGKAAMRFAVDHNDRVERLVVVDVAPRASEGGELGEIARAMLSVDTRAAATREEIDRALSAAVPDQRTRSFLLTNLRRDGGEGFAWRIGLEEILRSMPAIAAGVDVTGGYSGPTLFVVGAESDHFTPADGEAMRAAFPHGEVRSIAGAGHWVHADRPEEFLGIVAPFLTG